MRRAPSRHAFHLAKVPLPCVPAASSGVGVTPEGSLNLRPACDFHPAVPPSTPPTDEKRREAGPVRALRLTLRCPMSCKRSGCPTPCVSCRPRCPRGHRADAYSGAAPASQPLALWRSVEVNATALYVSRRSLPPRCVHRRAGEVIGQAPIPSHTALSAWQAPHMPGALAGAGIGAPHDPLDPARI